MTLRICVLLLLWCYLHVVVYSGEDEQKFQQWFISHGGVQNGVKIHEFQSGRGILATRALEV